MSFKPGKNKEAKKLRAVDNNPHSPQVARENAKQILHMTSPKSNQFDGEDDDDDDGASDDAVEQLIQTALDFLGRFEIESARQCVDEALKLATSLESRAAVLDVASQILISDSAPQEQVLAILNEAETLTPMSSHERLLDLAQFSSGTQCLQYYQNAITLLEQTVAGMHQELAKLPNTLKNKAEREELKFDIDDLAQVAATAMVAIAELYTTDLCDEEDAEKQCGHYLQLAISTDPMNVEAYRSMGNFCYIRYDATKPPTDMENQSLYKQAIQYSKQAYQILRKCYEQNLDHKIPEFIPRLELGRQLYELQCWEETLTVLTMILQEELEVAEIWLLCIVSSYRLAEQLHIESTQPPVSKSPAKVRALQEQVNSLLTCAAQYAVNCGRVIEAAEDKDAEIIKDLKQYIALLKEKGYTLAKAKAELDGNENVGDYDESILDGIESDDDDDGDDAMGEGNSGSAETAMGE